MSSIRRRKRYFIKPGFQSRLTMIFILIVIIVANIVGALVYAISIEKLQEKLVEEAKLPIDTAQLGQTLLPGIIIAELVSILIVAFISIFVTHTIAGPVYRMERVAKCIGSGDFTNFIKLRPKDELKDLADTMNAMTIGLREKITVIKDVAEKLKAGVERVKDSGKIEMIEDISNSVSVLDKACAAFVFEKELSAPSDDKDESGVSTTEA